MASVELSAIVKTEMSSAKISVVVPGDWGMSDSRMLNKRGDNEEPCGTPVWMGNGVEKSEPTETTALLFVR